MVKDTIVICLVALMFAACKTKYVQVPVKEFVEHKVVETVHDTTIKTQPDSTWYWALIKCRDGKPVITGAKDSGDKPGLKAPKVSLDSDGNLNVDCQKKAEELFAQWKSTYESKIITKEVPVYIEKQLGKWDKFYLAFGKYSFIILVTVATIILAIGTFKFFRR